ncbi:hypothetical protein HIV01_014800 [Lysobacter arenosi]|uniref:Uncharacterized protein n=1 Tax=Lysobacter arenosi TaxID=2795387 RepID=A0ABX7R8Q8_9GAMM|nr:hypothetical protein [Lysobacter arenosi]QSX74439.1 hypothetical protein HIV01_014800 [Lysobacter arenosi]
MSHTSQGGDVATNAKYSLAVSMLVLSVAPGCASLHRMTPDLVDVKVEAPVLECDRRRQDIPVSVRVQNGSHGVLRVWIDGASGPPYPLSWLSYEILDDAGNVAWRHGPGGHGPMAQPTLKIDPGDRTILAAMLYEVGEADNSRSFRIRIEDQDKNTWTTDAFRPCVKRD